MPSFGSTHSWRQLAQLFFTNKIFFFVVTEGSTHIIKLFSLSQSFFPSPHTGKSSHKYTLYGVRSTWSKIYIPCAIQPR